MGIGTAVVAALVCALAVVSVAVSTVLRRAERQPSTCSEVGQRAGGGLLGVGDHDRPVVGQLPPA